MHVYKDIIQLYILLLTVEHTFHTKMYVEFLSHMKVTAALLGNFPYRFRNWKVKWWLNVSTWKCSACLKVLLRQKPLSLSFALFSESQSTTFKFCTCNLHFLKLIWNKFYSYSTMKSCLTKSWGWWNYILYNEILLH